MPVYFVYRCHYNAPSQKHIRRFEHNTVLDWAKAVFRQLPTREEGDAYAEELLGGLHVYSFGSLFTIDDEWGEAFRKPKTMKDVHDWFGGMYVNEQKNGAHHIQIHTDDDELEMAVYIFDDHYRKKNPGKADFLLLDGWELPAGAADGDWKPPAGVAVQSVTAKPKRGQSSIYAAFLAYYDSGNLDLDGGHRVAPMRLPDLARYLLTEWADTEMEGEWEVLRQAIQKHMRSRTGADAGFRAAIRKAPEDLTNWGVYADWLQDRNEPPPGAKILGDALRLVTPAGEQSGKLQKKSDMIRVTPHMIQACFHTANWGEDKLYHQWIFFDDRWAAAHPTLAAGILTFAARWDVLS